MVYIKNYDITMPIFDGSDYTNWEENYKLLQFKKC